MSLSTAIHAHPPAFIFACQEREERSRKAWRLYQRRTQTGYSADSGSCTYAASRVDLDGKGKRVTYNVLQPIDVRLEHHVCGEPYRDLSSVAGVRPSVRD